MPNICFSVRDLVEYGISHALVKEADRTYLTNSLLSALHLSDYDDSGYPGATRELEEILADLCDYAAKENLMGGDSVVYRDLFDTALMGLLTPPPSAVIENFGKLYKKSPQAATDYFYRLSNDCNYIRTYRVKKDLRWTYDSPYGEIEISVNLSKPEKDPKAIAAAKLLPPRGYPKCLLCHENEGYAGTLSAPARQNLRQIPITMDGNDWYLQYSPYVYYNEHCIALSGRHTPMKIDRSTFRKLLDFVEIFPHYFLGSNADLPIVGGSILSHDHMQGGHHTFAMAKAPVIKELHFPGFANVSAGILRWPLSVIRLSSTDKTRMIELADLILTAWRDYSDPDAFIFAKTDGEPHNTITPIARKNGDRFELDLVLRNNITTKEYPLGLYHPHPELHNIKKENIGLIEVMGLAVLPARLKKEIELMCDAILSGTDFETVPEIKKHKDWFARFAGNYAFTKENVYTILQQEIGRTFTRVLEDAGVYKTTEEGLAAFERFCRSVIA
ncbi:MAG: UDP-glucose--hexose-1-phosphate uridylyltransferase [Clostridia bacterium]|nr:UDP-glucose--hexose-1-phosphate uridylyltransferase [Clostridia bacterium]MDD7700953.1 UDP-glucose--hexose-1-phosphate uridylyltransferase [Eubacteriales bacterium]MDY2826360.1 UDP-glucose--hexose-1-phosphate uridylyltransferase [Eubacteriales bacterium]